MKRFGLTTEHVVGRFEIGYPGGTAAAQVPGGRRLEALPDPGTKDMLLYSYRTIVAARRQEIAPDGLSETIKIALNPRKYSRTTSKVMSGLRRLLVARGYEKTDETQDVAAAVPGRWGGFGPAWHATGVETLPFEVWARKSERHAGSSLRARERDGIPTGAR